MSGKSRTARERVKENKYDVEAWTQLLREAQNRGKMPEIRNVYEEILTVFPTAAHYWKAYAEAELADNNIAEVKSVFARCLKGRCPNVELWRSYLQFIKKMNDGRGGSGDAVQVQKAYEYTLDQVGCDVAAGVVWQEYINFLKSPKPGSPSYAVLFGGAAGKEESKRTVMLRRAYQRALIVPTNSIDNIWRSYESFEKEAGKNLAASMLAEYKFKYQAARTVLHERKKLLEGIKWTALALPVSARSTEMEQQAALWRKYIAYEASNPQQLEKEALQARVGLAYDQALMFLYHYPEFWHDAAAWHMTHPLGGGIHSASLLFRRSRAAIPNCPMLRYAAADAEEAAALRARADNDELEAEKHLEAAETVYKELIGEGDDVSEVQEDPRSRTLSWILYMRFARRSLSVKKSREVFMRARKWPDCCWEVYAASAMMEWERGREEKVTRNIFESGLKKFLTNHEYIDAYAGFLLGIGDAVNARTLYERALQDLTDPAVAKPLWDSFLRFEYRVGTLDAYLSIEKRRREALEGSTSDHDTLEVLMLRYNSFGLSPVSGSLKSYVHAKVSGRPWAEAEGEKPARASAAPEAPAGTAKALGTLS
eukprot:CAMPEP_0177599148 /NCGR_PEP_ID=MMETSP0419_2-20121207/12809_1 /TAXON_ID=582737 /ORGANISM="Tetraselmis sp., Strain GSL018" /LENGTH=595 /DNA_ID=CAMNT_0019091803 /DNA_START=119 /DNA_END=1903 /DNA_ORIENTATION=-